MSSTKVILFQDLIAWQISHSLCIAVFKKSFNNHNLRNQIERSSLSVTSNIAEGFGRSSLKDKEHFYVMARGSAYEVQSQLVLSFDLALINKAEFNELFELSTKSIKLLHGLIKSTRQS